MKLTDGQKAAVTQARERPGHERQELVRTGDRWSCVWLEPEQPPRERWRGQLVSRVLPNPAGQLTGDPLHIVWWTGSEKGGRTRREVVEQLRLEALI